VVDLFSDRGSIPRASTEWLFSTVRQRSHRTLVIFPGFGGRSPVNATNDRPSVNAWTTIADNWFDAWYDKDHKSSPAHDAWAPRDSQQVLAHELDHLNGEAAHVDANPAITAHSQICSGL
jgi:hypothetical protein